MTEYNFPSIDPELARARLHIHPRDIDPWMAENLAKCLFPVEKIKSDQVRFRYADRCGPSVNGIYFLLYEGDVVYVGKASNIATRLRAHWKSEKVWTHFWCITDIPDRCLEDVESMYISWLDPIVNIKCQGCTELGASLIENLEPYRPFRAMRTLGGWILSGGDAPEEYTDAHYIR